MLLYVDSRQVSAPHSCSPFSMQSCLSLIELSISVGPLLMYHGNQTHPPPHHPSRSCLCSGAHINTQMISSVQAIGTLLQIPLKRILLITAGIWNLFFPHLGFSFLLKSQFNQLIYQYVYISTHTISNTEFPYAISAATH